MKRRALGFGVVIMICWKTASCNFICQQILRTNNTIVIDEHYERHLSLSLETA